MHLLLHAWFIGVVATAVMDIWGVLRRRLLGVAGLDLALLGRWIGHLGRGRLLHEAISRAAPVQHERFLGWGAHYLIGVTFAALLLAINGMEWLQQPTIGPALTVGLVTVAAPLLIMQPAMGLGVAASRTPRPAHARLQSLLSHTVFGLGLYLAGWLDHLLFLH